MRFRNVDGNGWWVWARMRASIRCGRERISATTASIPSAEVPDINPTTRRWPACLDLVSTAASLLSGLGTFVDKFEGFADQDFTGAFAQARSGHVGVAFEAVEIFFGENVSEGVIGEPEQQVM